MSCSSDRLTPYVSRFTRLLLCSLATGCSNIIRSGLMNSNTVFLDPSMNRTTYSPTEEHIGESTDHAHRCSDQTHDQGLPNHQRS